MRIRLAVPAAAIAPEVLDAALEAVTRTNERLLRAGGLPLAREAIARGVRWRPEPVGDEHFDDARTVVQRGHGDCDDLAPYHAASLRVTGEDPAARAIVYRSGPKRWHAVVERGDGRIEDPSRAAGMGGYRPPVQPRLRGAPGRPSVSVGAAGGIWHARLDTPIDGLDGCAWSTHAIAPTRVQAVRRAVVSGLAVGEASGSVDPALLGRLAALERLLAGVPPRLVRQACDEYLRAHPDDGAVVGSLFGSALSAAASLVPGGSIALEAGKALGLDPEKMLTGAGKKGAAAKGAAPGSAPAGGYGPTVGPAPAPAGWPPPPPYPPSAPPVVVVRY